MFVLLVNIYSIADKFTKTIGTLNDMARDEIPDSPMRIKVHFDTR